MCGLGRSPDNSLMVVCRDEVVVAAVCNAMARDDVATAVDVAAAVVVDVEDADGVVVVFGVVVAVVVWVQQCWMRACISP